MRDRSFNERTYGTKLSIVLESKVEPHVLVQTRKVGIRSGTLIAFDNDDKPKHDSNNHGDTFSNMSARERAIAAQKVNKV